MVAVSSPPIGTSRWITSDTETSGTTVAGGALLPVHAAASATAAPMRNLDEKFEVVGGYRLFGGVTGRRVHPRRRRRSVRGGGAGEHESVRRPQPPFLGEGAPDESLPARDLRGDCGTGGGGAKLSRWYFPAKDGRSRRHDRAARD